MPTIKYQDFHANESSPIFENMTELFNKTATTPRDWAPMKKDIREWYYGFLDRHGDKNFNTAIGDQERGMCSKKLWNDYEDQSSVLFKGLDRDGISNALNLVIRRTCYNVRRRKRKRSRSDTSQARPQSKEERHPTPLNQVNLSARCYPRGRHTRLLLLDLGKESDPPLALEDVVGQATVANIKRLWSEDLKVDPSKMKVWFQFGMAELPSMMNSDRQLHSALAEIVENKHDSPIFELILGSEEPPEPRMAVTAAYSQISRK